MRKDLKSDPFWEFISAAAVFIAASTEIDPVMPMRAPVPNAVSMSSAPSALAELIPGFLKPGSVPLFTCRFLFPIIPISFFDLSHRKCFFKRMLY